MKKNIILKVFIITIIIMLISTVKSYAAVAITKDGTVLTGVNISDSFDMCREMTEKGQGIEGSNVNSHMATNGEWAAVSYFSNSNYGTDTQGQNTGISITMDDKEYFSTNGNVTGIMNWGKTVTFTSGILSNYSEILEDSAAYNNGKSLIRNSNLGVDFLDSITTDKVSIANNGWYNSWNTFYNSLSHPYSVRLGLFGFFIGVGGGYVEGSYGKSDGSAEKDVTFRPIIIN